MTADRDALRVMLPGLDSLLVLDAPVAGRILAERPDVWDILRAYLAAEPPPALDVEAMTEAMVRHRDKWHSRIGHRPWGACIPECGRLLAEEYDDILAERKP